MIALLENGSYLSTERLVDPGRCEITRTASPESKVIMERVKLGLGMDFSTVEATLMQASCILQEEKINGQGGFTMNRGILDLMALEEAGILQNIKPQETQGDAIADPWQLHGNNFAFHHELFRQAVDIVAVNPIDWEQIDTNKNRRSYLYTENFTSSFAFARMLDPHDRTRYGVAGYQIFALVDSGDIVLTPALAGVVD